MRRTVIKGLLGLAPSCARPGGGYVGVVGPVVVRQLARRAQAPSASPSVHAWRDFGGQSCTAGGGQLPLLRVRASPAWGARGFISGLAPASYRQAATAVSSASEDAVAASRDGEGTAVRKQPPPKKATHQAQHHLYPRAISKAWSVKTSMKKLNTVCKLVRLAHVDAALLQLALTAKKAAKFVRKLIHEAKFNAAAMGMDPDKLIVDEIRIGRAKYLKRIEFKAKGKTGVIRKPYCHIFVFVREIQNQDQFVYKHLKRKRPRWKCGRLN